MVSQLTALTKSGLKDWFIQRVSAVLMLLYTVFMIVFIAMHPHMNYHTWVMLFNSFWMRAATLLVILSLLAHAWIGIWTVLTDYVHCSALRVTIQVCVVLAILACALYGFIILWG